MALLIGLLVVGVQVISPRAPGLPAFNGWMHADISKWAASYGINVLPYNKLQKYVTSVDLRSAVQDNVAMKISFGTTFAMAAFMHL